MKKLHSLVLMVTLSLVGIVACSKDKSGEETGASRLVDGPSAAIEPGSGGVGVPGQCFSTTFDFTLNTSSVSCVPEMTAQDAAAAAAVTQGLIADCYSCSDLATYTITNVQFVQVLGDSPCPNGAGLVRSSKYTATFTCNRN